MTRGRSAAELELRGGTIEYELLPGGDPPLVFLHEGLGCLGLWRGLPAEVADKTGRAVLAYSRFGYGCSDPVALPRPVRYMHDEALTVLPELLDALDLHRPLLIGHSDGASIALIHAGARSRPVTALALLAPHVIVEDETVAGIASARDAYLGSDLAARLGRWHRDVDATFWGWNDVWLSPEFRGWDIRGSLPGITEPVLILQGDADSYGTWAQVEAIERGVSGPCRSVPVPGAGHALHLERRAEIVEAVTDFVSVDGS
ncbi:MAG: alpha/beta fold hydrolase [Pseudonocardiaceae bacterium]|nr:alpha/beta fold hydrolase [Pseudonocardiaceae bacterium]